jgi:hypothetical protein
MDFTDPTILLTLIEICFLCAPLCAMSAFALAPVVWQSELQLQQSVEVVAFVASLKPSPQVYWKEQRTGCLMKYLSGPDWLVRHLAQS